MLEKILVWLVVASTAMTAIPSFAVMPNGPPVRDDTPILQNDLPPPAASTDGRRHEGRGQLDTQSVSRLKHRSSPAWRSLWLALGLLIPCLVLSLGRRSACAEDDFLARPAVFRDDGPLDGPPLIPVDHEAGGHPLPRYQASPNLLPNNWLSAGEKIPVAQVEDYPRIPALDYPDGLFDTWRPNLMGIDVPEEWDFQNLINTDRPDFTDATFSVGEGIAYLETGYTFRNSNSDEIHLRRQQLPESLLRIGATDELELRMKWNGHITTDVFDVTSGLKHTTVGGDDLQLGVKYEVVQQEGWRPMLTFVGGTVVPTGTRGVSANQVQPNAQFVCGWGIRRWLYLKASTGVDFAKTSDATHVIEGSLQEGPVIVNTEDNVSQWHQSLSLLYQASPRVGGFLEWFSFFSDNASDNRASHFLDTGLYIYLTPNVQLDVRVGERVSNRVDTLFTGAGFSTRW